MHFITTAQDKSLELTVRAQNAVREWASEQARRLRDETGQTAAEYLGVLVVVSVIIAAVTTTGVGDDIKNWIGDVVEDISKGKSSKED